MREGKCHIPFHDLQRRNSYLGEELRNAIDQVIDSGNYLFGKQVRALEIAFSTYCGTKHAISVANGTDALELALRTAGCVAGDEVITTANAGGYAATAIYHAGATPVFADVNPKNFLLDTTHFLRSITPQTKAVVVTHLYGCMADMASLCMIAKEHGIRVIEDCAQAHGASWNGRKAGAWGDLGCFSFYPTKNLGSLGDAGMVVTSNEIYAQRLKSLRQYGWGEKYHMTQDIGRNSRMDEMQAAVLLCLLPHLDAWNTKRRAIVARYREALEPLGIGFQCVTAPEHFVAHLCAVTVKDRNSFQDFLHSEGIVTVIHYPVADHVQPAIVKRMHKRPYLPVTEKLSAQIVSLPCFPELTGQEVDYVIDAVKQFLTSGMSHARIG